MAASSKTASARSETKLVQELADILDKTGLAELEYETDAVAIRLSRVTGATPVAAAAPAVSLPTAAAPAVSPQHSWNTNSLLSNSLAFNLGLHADHHANPQRAFPQLRQIDAAPQLPAGYLTMLSIAAVPMLWRAVMDPRLDRLAASGALASR